jgi:hypothetical protein
MNAHEPKTMDHLLDELTSAVLENQRLAGLFTSDEVAQILPFLGLIRHLRQAYRPRRANRRFAARLQRDLMGRDYTVMERVRYLPPQVQIAACLAIVGTVLVLLRGRSVLAGQALGQIVTPVEAAS